jgi:hypothetical protein
MGITYTTFRSFMHGYQYVWGMGGSQMQPQNGTGPVSPPVCLSSEKLLCIGQEQVEVSGQAVMCGMHK